MNSLSGLGPRNMSTGSMRQRPSFSNDITPKGYRTGQLQQYTPEQLQLFSQLFGHVGPESFLSRLSGGDESTFNQIEAPQMRQFNELVGNISNRFSMGSGKNSLGNLRSSGFQNAGTAAASNFAQDLASQRQELQRQALMDLMGISNSLLGQRPYDRFLTEKPQSQKTALGGWGGLLGGIGGGLLGSFAGNPLAGSYIGSNALSGL